MDIRIRVSRKREGRYGQRIEKSDKRFMREQDTNVPTREKSAKRYTTVMTRMLAATRIRVRDKEGGRFEQRIEELNQNPTQAQASGSLNHTLEKRSLWSPYIPFQKISVSQSLSDFNSDRL